MKTPPIDRWAVAFLLAVGLTGCLAADDDADLEDDDAAEDEDITFRPTNPACATCNWTTTGSGGSGNYVVKVHAALGNGWQYLTDTNVLVTLTLVNSAVVSYNLGNVDLTTISKSFQMLPTPSATVASGTITITFAGSPPTVVTGDLLPP